jgi:hypothetical protein
MKNTENKPKTFLRITKSTDDKLPVGSMVEVKMMPDGSAKVISDPMPFPEDRVAKK